MDLSAWYYKQALIISPSASFVYPKKVAASMIETLESSILIKMELDSPILMGLRLDLINIFNRSVLRENSELKNSKDLAISDILTKRVPLYEIVAKFHLTKSSRETSIMETSKTQQLVNSGLFGLISDNYK